MRLPARLALTNSLRNSELPNYFAQADSADKGFSVGERQAEIVTSAAPTPWQASRNVAQSHDLVSVDLASIIRGE
jgi:hypothetical protein